MATTRVSHRFRCRTKDCPWPKDEEMHRNWCGHSGKSTHLHHPKKGMGGNNPESKIVAIACWACHDSIDNNMGSIHQQDIPGQGLTTWGMDLHGNTLFTKVLEPWVIRPGAEEIITSKTDTIKSGSGSPAVEQQKNNERSRGSDDSSTAELPAGANPVSPALASAVPAGNAAAEASAVNDSPTGTSLHRGGISASVSAAASSYDEWARAIKQLARGGHTWQFSVGDAANIGEAQFGEEAWQTLDELGIQPESLSNIMRVCRAIPLRIRNDSLKYSHFYQVYKLAEKNPEEAQYWLRQAEENKWTIREFKDALRGEGLLPPRKTVKRWTAEELRLLYEPPDAIVSLYCFHVGEWLDGLEAQDD